MENDPNKPIKRLILFFKESNILSIEKYLEVGSMIKIKLWDVRNEKGYSIRSLEEITGISKSEINNIENGRISPRLVQLEKLAVALNVGIVDLFESEHKYAVKANGVHKFAKVKTNNGKYNIMIICSNRGESGKII